MVHVFTFGQKNSARNKDQKLVGRFVKIGYFYRLLITVSLKMYRKQIVGWPDTEIGWKMANTSTGKG